MPDPQQQQRFTDQEMQNLANDPAFTDDDWKLLTEPERVRFLQAKGTRIGSTPPAMDADAGHFQMPSPLAPPPSTGEPLNLFGSVAKIPGTLESALPAPLAFIDSFLPQAKPLTIPLAGLLGGVGSVADDFRAGTPLDVGSFLGGAGRQAALETVGRALAGPAAYGLTRAAMPGAESRAVRAAVDAGPFRTANTMRDAAAAAGKAIDDRLANYSGVQIPTSQLFDGADALIAKTAGQSMKENDVRALMRDEINDSLRQLPSSVSPQRANALKRGARVGYESITRRQIQNAPVSPPTKIQSLVGDNAQKLLEDLDDAMRPAGAPSLADINARSGALQSLQRYSRERADSGPGSMLGRMALGSTIGGLAAAPFDGGYERYGAVGLPAGLMFALAPSAPGRLAQIAGASLPPLARGTTMLINSMRQQPDSDATTADDSAAPNVRRRQPR
jgi:hypothetical protein